MKLETMATLVDTVPLFQALAEVKGHVVDDETRAFLIHKINKTCKDMISQAKYAKARLDALTRLDAQPPPSKRKSKASARNTRGGRAQ